MFPLRLWRSAWDPTEALEDWVRKDCDVLRGEIRMPHIDDQDDPRFLALVHDLVLEGVVEGQSGAPGPASPLAPDAQARGLGLGYLDSQMVPQAKVRGAAMGLDMRMWLQAREHREAEIAAQRQVFEDTSSGRTPRAERVITPSPDAVEEQAGPATAIDQQPTTSAFACMRSRTPC